MLVRLPGPGGFWQMSSRFPSNPLILRVPFFLLFSFNNETPTEKGKRVLLGSLVFDIDPNPLVEPGMQVAACLGAQ